MSPDATGAVWDRVWKGPDGWYPNEFVVRFLAKYVRKRTGIRSYKEHGLPRRRVLDIGCGSGRHLIMLAREGYDTYGIDVSARSIGFAREWLESEGLRADLRTGSVTKLPYDDGSFDVVIACGVLDHMTDADARLACREVARVLAPGGLFYADLVSARESGCGKGKLIGRLTYLIEEGDEAGAVQRFFELEDVLTLLRESFEVLDVVHDEWQAVHGQGFSALDKTDYPRLSRYHAAARKREAKS